jgi:hypothetical protein
VTKYLRSYLKKRKDLFWLTVLEVSVRGQLSSLFRGHGKEGCGGEKLFTSWQPGSRKTERKGLGTIYTSGGLLPPIKPHLLIVHSAMN